MVAPDRTWDLKANLSRMVPAARWRAGSETVVIGAAGSVAGLSVRPACGKPSRMSGYIAAIFDHAANGASAEPLRALPPGQERVAVVSLASVRALSQRRGIELDPLSFPADLYVEGWPAGAETDWTGKPLMIGWARAEVIEPIAPNAEGEACGVWVRVTSSGPVGVGDAVTSPSAQQEPA
jgi:hypothetical protein